KPYQRHGNVCIWALSYERGGPARSRARSVSIDPSFWATAHIASIHHVAPASAHGRATEAAATGSSPGVVPSTTMSYGSLPRSALTYAAISRTSSTDD